MIYLIFLLHLSTLPLIAIFIGLFSKTTIQLLLVVVIVVFIQGLVLLSLGNSIIGSYIIIIYIGAIVILFAFCILFINSKETSSNTIKNHFTHQGIEKLLTFTFILFLWEIFSSLVSGHLIKTEVNSSFDILTESNYMLSFAEHLFSNLLIPLLLMILILLLGLILTIKIIKKK